MNKLVNKKSTLGFNLSVLFLCLSIFFSNLLWAESEKSILQIANSGAPSLAMHMLDKKQKYLTNGSESFLKYEQQRHQILGHWQQWQKGLDRLNLLPNNIPKRYKNWAQTLKVIYHLELAEYEQALYFVRNLLWSGEKQAKKQFSLWQKLVIRIYLKSDAIQDAEKAMLRYQQDYQDQEITWLLLQAEILIRSGRSEEVLDLISTKKDNHFLLFKLLAQLNTKKVSNEVVYEKAKKQAQKETKNQSLQAKFWLLAARAAFVSGSAVRTAVSYDKAARLKVATDDVLFPFSGDQLWDAYLALGYRVGNKERLLLGDDEQWFEMVEKSLPNFPIRAKSLLSVVALQSQSINNQNRAFNQLVKLILKDKDGLAILKNLFIGTQQFSDYQTIPHQARYVLVDDALAQNNIVEASKLISELKKPQGVDKFKWELRRARILIMGSDYIEGAGILEELIQANADYGTDKLDQITQVLFDLQSVEQHEQAIKLFTFLAKRPITPKRKREIMFWQAESYDKLTQYEDAALMYFKSAYFFHEKGGDPWGQTARFNAAESLAEAGLIGDAQRTFDELLRFTKNKKRRSVIQSRLKGLWLKLKNESNITTN